MTPSRAPAREGVSPAIENISTEALRSMPREMMLAILVDGRRGVIDADAACPGAVDPFAQQNRAIAFLRWERAVRLWNIWKGLQPA